MFRRGFILVGALGAAIVLTATAAFASTQVTANGTSAAGATFSVTAHSDKTGSVDYSNATFTGHCTGYNRYIDEGPFPLKQDVALYSNTCYVPGSPFSDGPQGMEGDLKVAPGETLKAGFDVTMPGGHPETVVTVIDAHLDFDANCVSGTGGGPFSVLIPNEQYTIAADETDWVPSGDQHDDLVYQGSIQVPDLCNGGDLRLNEGGTFFAYVTSTHPENDLQLRWHYSAHGTSGSWSGTSSVDPQGPLSVWMDLTDYTNQAKTDRAAFAWAKTLARPNKLNNFIYDRGLLQSGDISIS